MKAEIHRFPTAGAAGAEQPAADADHGTRGQDSGTLLSSLIGLATRVLDTHLREMFERSDDFLLELADKARGSTEQQLYLDTMRSLRLHRARLLDQFRDALRNTLTSGDMDTRSPGASASPEDMSQWALMDREVVEEMISLRNLETRAASLQGFELVELQRRLMQLSAREGGKVPPDSLSPARVIKAFQSSLQGLDFELPIRQVMYRLFDQLVLARLSEVVIGANRLLAQHGIEPKFHAKPPGKPEATAAGSAFATPDFLSEPARDFGAAPGTAAPPGAAPGWASGLDAALLQRYLGQAGGGGAAPAAAGWGWTGGAPAAAPATGAPWSGTFLTGAPAGAGDASARPRYSDAALAQDVSAVLSSLSAGRWPQAPSWMSATRVGLIARMFETYFRDPRLSEDAKPLLARLQLPVMKAALSDPSFFNNPDHPVRRSANELFELLLQFSSSKGAPTPQAYDELNGLIQAIVQSFDVDPARLLARTAPPVDERTAESFLREQEGRLRGLKRTRIERIRRIVANELRGQIGERSLSRGVMRLMLSGFGPLLCLDYIRGGVGGAGWIRTMQLVGRVLDSLEPRAAPAEEKAAYEAEIVTAITQRLTQVGFTRERIEELLTGLLQAYLEQAQSRDAPSPPAPEEPAAEPAPSPPSVEQQLQHLLFVILVPGAWFSLWDAGTRVKHWVRVRSYYPNHDAVVLGHYWEDRCVRLSAAGFATALVEGHATIIDPSPDLRKALSRLAELPFARRSEPLAWTSGSAAAPGL